MKLAKDELNRLFGNKDIDKIVLNAAEIPEDDRWNGDLSIEGYHNLTEINLTGHLIGTLVVRDCPKLQLLDMNKNSNVKIDLSQLTLDASGKPVANTSLTQFFANFNKELIEINFKNCTKLEEISLNHSGTIEKFEGGEDFDASLKSVSYEGTNGISFTGTNHLKDLKGKGEAVDAILGNKPLPTKKDPSGNVIKDNDGKPVIDTDELKNQLVVESSKSPNSPAKNALDNINKIKDLLGLTTSATESEIIAKIKELMGKSPTGDYITKWALTESAKGNLEHLGVSKHAIDEKLKTAKSASEVETLRNQMINNQFGELQISLRNAHYLNIGLGALSAGILVLLAWMALRDKKKMLSDQEEEKIKE